MKISLFHELNMDDGESHGSVDVLKKRYQEIIHKTEYSKLEV